MFSDPHPHPLFSRCVSDPLGSAACDLHSPTHDVLSAVKAIPPLRTSLSFCAFVFLCRERVVIRSFTTAGQTRLPDNSAFQETWLLLIR